MMSVRHDQANAASSGHGRPRRSAPVSMTAIRFTQPVLPFVSLPCTGPRMSATGRVRPLLSAYAVRSPAPTAELKLAREGKGSLSLYATR